MQEFPTPHISAKPEDFAKTVLMPGDPKRARFIAENYLTNAVLVNDIRGVQGYTGMFGSKRVSVMASGMGVPSMGIYSHELFTVYDIDRIIRIGSAGAIHPALKPRDLVIGMGACTNSNFASQYRLPGTYAPIASYSLLQAAVREAERRGSHYMVGNLFCTDSFYDDAKSLAEWQRMGVLAVEMESVALYCNAARTGKDALCICTISDCPMNPGADCTVEERERSFTEMIEIALEIA